MCKKLDRFLINDQWLDFFPNSYSSYDVGGCSDHLRGRITLESTDIRRRKPFKFANMLTRTPKFIPTVKDFWTTTAPIYVSTSALFGLGNKLKNLKPLLRVLGKDILGDISKPTKEAYDSLVAKQTATLHNPNCDAINEENIAYGKWQKLADLEEEYLRQKEKLHWLDVGDRNNAYFYRSTRIRRMKNFVREVHGPNNEVFSNIEDIKLEAVRFYEDFLTHQPHRLDILSMEQLKELMRFRCSETDKLQLTKEVTDEDVSKVLFDMPTNKSPGPDGYTCEFFKASWSVVEQDFTKAIQSFFIKGFLPKGLNTTIIALIPETDSSRQMKDYRPISCCNLIYKVISKIIATRLKRILPDFINMNQSAFVEQCLLMKNILLAMEFVKDYHKPKISSRCAMKIDISKVFDSVQWKFVLNTLAALNFPDVFIHWIRLCITTPSFSIQVNG